MSVPKAVRVSDDNHTRLHEFKHECRLDSVNAALEKLLDQADVDDAEDIRERNRDQ